MSRDIYLFTRFERFWHWTQAALIFVLLFTGFAIHGSHGLIGFRAAVEVHEIAAYLLIALWVFAIFWHFTTGVWRQYIPTAQNIDRMIRYYVYGIFVGEEHPFRITVERKHNPLQRLAYLGVKLLINPLIWISGLIYLFWGRLQGYLPEAIGLQQVSLAHTLGAFLMLAFVVIHVCLTTTGQTPFEKIRVMITGWESHHEDDVKIDRKAE
jgi:thiosulfate reductase cytochrome b subunit